MTNIIPVSGSENNEGGVVVIDTDPGNATCHQKIDTITVIFKLP